MWEVAVLHAKVSKERRNCCFFFALDMLECKAHLCTSLHPHNPQAATVVPLRLPRHALLGGPPPSAITHFVTVQVVTGPVVLKLDHGSTGDEYLL